MRKLIRIAVVLALLAGGSLIAGQVSIGITIGPPPPPRVIAVVPASPGPQFVWIAGYWYPAGGRYRWHEGYWSRPPYEGARWVGPRYEGSEYLVGYWEGDRGRVQHDHRWDRDHDRRDFDRKRHRHHHGDHGDHDDHDRH
jgi:YXWGXW repeat-containing protein